MKTIKGDLIDLFEHGHFDMIIHGCNCFCTMGAGIAKQIKEKYPDAFAADKLTESGDIRKMGSYSFAKINTNHSQAIIVNAYTQFRYDRLAMHANYGAIRKVFEKINNDFPDKSLRIGIPKIGAGLAGGDWAAIEPIIEGIMGERIIVVEYSPAK